MRVRGPCDERTQWNDRIRGTCENNYHARKKTKKPRHQRPREPPRAVIDRQSGGEGGTGRIFLPGGATASTPARFSTAGLFGFDKRRGWSRLSAKHSHSFFLLLQLTRVKNSSPPPSSLFLCFSVYISAWRREGSTSGLPNQPCGGEGRGRRRKRAMQGSPSVSIRLCSSFSSAIVRYWTEDWTSGPYLRALGAEHLQPGKPPGT